MSLTVGEIFNKIDNFHKPTPDTVMVRFTQGYGFLEFKKEFIESLKNEIRGKAFLKAAGFKSLTNLELFALIVLEESN